LVRFLYAGKENEHKNDTFYQRTAYLFDNRQPPQPVISNGRQAGKILSITHSAFKISRRTLLEMTSNNFYMTFLSLLTPHFSLFTFHF